MDKVLRKKSGGMSKGRYVYKDTACDLMVTYEGWNNRRLDVYIGIEEKLKMVLFQKSILCEKGKCSGQILTCKVASKIERAWGKCIGKKWQQAESTLCIKISLSVVQLWREMTNIIMIQLIIFNLSLGIQISKKSCKSAVRYHLDLSK